MRILLFLIRRIFFITNVACTSALTALSPTEEAEEEPAKPLERLPKKWDREQRAEEPTLTMVVETQEREEPVGKKSDEPAGQPDPNREQALPQGLSPRQPEQQPKPPRHEDEQRTPTDGGEHEREHGTCQQWLGWLEEQVSGVADQLDEEQRQRGHLMRTTTKELQKVRAQMRGMEEELTRAKEYVASMASMGQHTSVDTESVVSASRQKPTSEPESEQAVEAALKTGTEYTQELRALKQELAAQEALRGKDKEQKKLAEEERRRVQENLRKSQANNDRLKEEREKLLQDKDKLRRQAETEIHFLGHERSIKQENPL